MIGLIVITYFASVNYQIKSIIKTYFNGPNHYVVQALNEAVKKSSEMLENTNSNYAPINLDDLAVNLFGNYFTEQGLQSFFARTEPYRYHTTLNEQQIRVQTKGVDIKRVNSNNDKYDTYFFDASLLILRSATGTKELFLLSGSAQCKKSSKINYMTFRNLKDLYKVLLS